MSDLNLTLREAEGRPLTGDGQSESEKRQRLSLERFRARALKEAVSISGFDKDELQNVWAHPEFSIKKFREAVAETQFPQLLRFGVQNFLFDGYASVPVIYPDLVRVVNSTGAEELYAPLYGVELPRKVSPGQPFGDSRLQGLDAHVKNDKYGRMLAIERELVDDDRTGQIVTRAGQLGERMRYVEEQVVITALEAGQYTTAIGNVTPGNAQYPFGQVSQNLLEGADIAMEGMLDPLGNKMLVMPDTLLVSPADKFTAAKLLQSTLQPSVPGAAGQTASTASSGVTGWTMTVNPLQGLYALKVSRFLPSSNGLDGTHGHAYLLDAKKSLVFQDRDGLEVAQEATNAGEAFATDTYRWRVRRRFAAALVEPRYGMRIN